MSFAEWSNNRKKQKEEGASQTVAYEAAPSGNSDTGYSFSQWSNNRKKQREESASQTVAYEATPLRNSDTSCSFSQWSNNKKSEEAEKSAVGWLNASQNLLTEVQNYYQHWSNDDTQYRSFQDRASNLLSGADSWRKEYAGNDEAIKVIDSAVCSLSNLKKYAMKCQDYYSDWATEEQYQRAKEYYDTWGHYLEADDFEYYSAQGAAIQNPSVADAEGYFNFFGWRPGSEEVGNIVTYSRDNYANIAAMSEGGKYDVVGDLRYKDMTDDEVAIYNYLLAKEGKERAGEFLSYIEEDLNARGGKRTADLITSINIPVVEELATGLYGLGAGIDQWISGTRQFFTNEQLPISIAQYANSEIADSLDGFGKNLYTGANVIGNMAPSILLSYVTAGLGAPAAVAQGVGAAAVGMSAAGNAYGSALADGYSIGQARAYSTLVGAAEGTLQYILGGIGSLGGVTDDLIKAKINMIDNSLLRIGAKLGVDVFSEVTEEELQNFLEPAFRSIIFGEEYDAPTIDEMLETAIVTAGTTILLGGSGTVSSDLAANKLLNATAQMANDQTNTPYNQQDVAKRLMDKGFNPEKSAKMADAIAVRLNDQKLTKIQTDRLRAATDNAVVRDVMSDITKKKADEIDSVQNDVYDKIKTPGGNAVTENSASRQEQNATLEGTEEGDTVAKKPYATSRPSYGKGQIEQVWEMNKDSTGKVWDPSGAELIWDPTRPRNGQWDMGHLPEHKYSVWHQKYMDDELSLEEFLEWYRNPAHYRPELPSTNRSHKYE